MAQTGTEPPYEGREGRIHTDRYQGRDYPCGVRGCRNPCQHCKERCSGTVSWNREDFEQGRIVFCTANASHAYRVIESG